MVASKQKRSEEKIFCCVSSGERSNLYTHNSLVILLCRPNASSDSRSTTRKKRSATYPSGGWTPSSSSKDLREVEVAACLAGAKATAEARREAKMTVFMIYFNDGR